MAGGKSCFFFLEARGESAGRGRRRQTGAVAAYLRRPHCPPPTSPSVESPCPRYSRRCPWWWRRPTAAAVRRAPPPPPLSGWVSPSARHGAAFPHPFWGLTRLGATACIVRRLGVRPGAGPHRTAGPNRGGWGRGLWKKKLVGPGKGCGGEEAGGGRGGVGSRQCHRGRLHAPSSSPSDACPPLASLHPCSLSLLTARWTPLPIPPPTRPVVTTRSQHRRRA